MTLIHVLGSDIPHHNLTVLRFFNDVLSVEQPAAAPRHFMVVTQQPESLAPFSALQIECFTSKKVLAQAVLQRARNRQQRFSATDSLTRGSGWRYSAVSCVVHSCSGTSGVPIFMKIRAA